MNRAPTDQRLQPVRRIAFRRRHALDDGLEHIGHAQTGLGADQHGVGGIETNRAFDHFLGALHVGARQILEEIGHGAEDGLVHFVAIDGFDARVVTVPGSTLKVTMTQINDPFNPPNWYNESMPPVVALPV